MVSVRAFTLFGLAGVCAVAPAFVASARAATITGTVVAEGADAKPVAGATVVLQEYDGMQILVTSAKTDAQGAFSLAASDKPEFAATRAKLGFQLCVYAPGFGIGTKAFKPGDSIRVPLPPEQVLKGTLSDAAGKPVAGATMRLSGGWTGDAARNDNQLSVPDAIKEFVSAKTNSAGKWEIRAIPKTLSVAAVMVSDPRFVQRIHQFDLRTQPAAGYTATAAPAGTIMGKVVNAAGQPVADVGIQVSKTGNNARDYYDYPGYAKTDANGVFKIGQLGSGSYRLSIDAQKQELVGTRVSGIAVTEGKTTPLATDIVLTRGAVISGSVVSKGDKKPLANVTIYANEWSTPVGTKADGTFQMRVEPGDNVVHVGSVMEGFAYFDPKQAVSIQEGETKTLAPFELPPVVAVTLQVSDEKGQPVPDLPVRVYHSGWQDGTTPKDYAKTDATGKWESKNDTRTQISAEASSPWEVLVPSEYEVVSPKTIPVPSDKPVAVVVRKLDISGRPRGRVVTPDGKPVAGMSVNVSSWFSEGGNQRDWKSQYNVRTDASGQFMLDPLRPNAEYTIGFNQGEYRLLKPVMKATIPADGKQPDLGDVVMVALDGMVSGVVVGANDKPVAGAWVWSPDGTYNVCTRTDAKGGFSLGMVPHSGDVTVSFARGMSVGTYTLAKRTANRLNLQTGAARPAPAVLAAQNRKRALAILAEMANESDVSVGVRAVGANADKLATLTAAFDLDLALRLGTGKDGKVDEGVLSEIMQHALRIAPDRVRALYVANLKNWASRWRKLWRSTDLAVVYAAKDPAFAQACYQTARKQVVGPGAIPPDRAWETMMVAKLAYYLHTPDADEMAERAIALTIKDYRGDKVQGTIGALRELAEGDGVRAAKLLDTLPADKRSEGAIAVLTGMLTDGVTHGEWKGTAQPAQAKLLWEKWFADGTIKFGDDRWSYNDAAVMPARLVKGIVSSSPEAAYKIAKQAPKSSRWQALLWAATGQKDPALRLQRYREAVATEDSEWVKAGHFAEAIRAATSTGDAAFVAEMRTALAKTVAASEAFYGNTADNAARATYTAGFSAPDMCRYYLEAAILEDKREHPDRDEVWSVRPVLQAMAILDLARAQDIARDFSDPSKQFEAKMEIVRALLTPPAQWYDMVNDLNPF